MGGGYITPCLALTLYSSSVARSSLMVVVVAVVWVVYGGCGGAGCVAVCRECF